MNRFLLNIEPSAFHKGRYVGYAHHTGVWYISHRSGGGWVAHPKANNVTDPIIYARTLAEMSDKLTER